MPFGFVLFASFLLAGGCSVLFSNDKLSGLNGGDGRKRRTKKSVAETEGPGLLASLLYSIR